ncbi:hypothetical protein RhiirA4_391213, partial [Rhizophagus irregularis]
AFGEVVGNAYYHDNVKMNSDRKKILKTMQLAFFKIWQLFSGDSPNLKNLEMYGILVYNKNHIISLQQDIESALKSRKKLNHDGTQHINDSIVYTSSLQKKI